MTPILLLAALGLAFLLTLWAIQLRTRDAATADVGWSILLAGGAVASAWITDGDFVRRLVVAALGCVWALRLGGYLLIDRVFAGGGEDGRYASLRAQWGADASRNFLLLYLAQGVVATLFLIPIAAAMQGGPLDGWAAAGALVWLLAVLGESVADGQLARFRADPANRGQVCRVGLWRYSRHPNYFFEWVHWWAYVLIAKGALLTLIGPVAMLLFLFRLTGIPYTERQALRSRGERYRAYQRTTSVFFPWPPRGGAA